MAGNGNMRKAANIVLRRICFGSLNIRFTGLLRIWYFEFTGSMHEPVCKEVIPMDR